MTQTLVKIGPKGQILIRKEYRNKLGLQPGKYAETVLTPTGLLITPINAQKELQEIHKIRNYIGKHWQRGSDGVDAVHEERR